jgi:hypothetical protein
MTKLKREACLVGGAWLTGDKWIGADRGGMRPRAELVAAITIRRGRGLRPAGREHPHQLQ